MPLPGASYGQMTTTDDFLARVSDFAQRLAECGVDALGALFDLTSQRLVRFAVALTGNQYDAEDAVQAALVRLAGDTGLLARTHAPWSYLLRMVRNEVLAQARRQRRRRDAGSLSDLATCRRVDELEQEDTHRAVWLALRSLPPDQAEVVVLKIWEGMTFSQMASILDASPNTIASRYRYAMEKLSRRLAHEQAEVRRD